MMNILDNNFTTQHTTPKSGWTYDRIKREGMDAMHFVVAQFVFTNEEL